MENYSTKLLGIEDAEIEKIEENEKEVRLRFRLRREKQFCPACGAETEKVHDYRIRRLRDTELHGKKLTLEYQRRRYACSCGRRFPETNSFVSRYQRFTQRITEKVVEGLHFRHSMKDISRLNGVSLSAVKRTLKCVTVAPLKKLPDTVAFDEFKGNTGKEKFQCIVTDPKAHKILDILPARTMETVQEYLNKFENREEVKFAVMDMNRGFFGIAKTFLPNATIVIDRFHVVRYCTEAMESVRKAMQKNLSKEQRKYFKRSRFLLLKHRKDLKQEDRDAVDVMLRFSDRLLQAYALKEAFYDFMASPDRVTASQKLDLWFDACDRLKLDEFNACRSMLRSWRPYILNAFDAHISNGFTEGCNNATKVLKRVAFGFRSFDNFRKRILLAADPYPYI